MRSQQNSRFEPTVNGPMTRVLFLLLFSFLTVSQASTAAVLPPVPTVAGSAWLLVDAETGFVITEHNADEPLPPASLTKLMTSYVLSSELAAGRVSNDDVVQVSLPAPRSCGSNRQNP